ncbi:glycosyltransferase [Candidatus Micrarchaeota archaeon]|nr:glycosyltransferase [Candidatus Micrarchaeota archaeon]
MLASVIVPTYNEEEHLERCLDSLRSQSFAADEIIVADGGSTDGTLDIARAWADSVVIERKRTIAAGRQAGADKASGRWLVFADGDSYYPKDWLLDLLRPFANAGVSCTHGKVLFNDANRLEQFMTDRIAPKLFKTALQLGYPSGAGSNLAIRSDIFKKMGGFNTDLVTAEDVDLQRRALQYGRNVYVEDAVAYISARRLRSWGYPKFVGFHVQNWMQYALVRKPMRSYEAVR